MNILGIETSCDETGAAVVKNGKKIISNIVASSVEMHALTGGIIPENAAREQVRSIIPVIDKSLERISIKNIDAIAVTVGPGLVGSLLVGVETAKTLSCLWQKPIVPVNHLVGHLYANWLDTANIPKLPALCLLVSGGHTDLIIMKGHAKFTWLGGTRDDAAGEAIDKCARLLSLPYPGGPSISKKAAEFSLSEKSAYINLPRPMIEEDNFDFSFSGLKTAVLREVQKLKAENNFNNLMVKQLAYEIQEAISDVLVDKTLRALGKNKIKTLLLAGGVAANDRLREKFLEKINDLKTKINFLVPPPKLCTDNAAYISSYAYFNFSPIPWAKVKTDSELSIIS